MSKVGPKGILRDIRSQVGCHLACIQCIKIYKLYVSAEEFSTPLQFAFCPVGADLPPPGLTDTLLADVHGVNRKKRIFKRRFTVEAMRRIRRKSVRNANPFLTGGVFSVR